MNTLIRMFSRSLNLIGVIALLQSSQAALAYPEFAGDGYFNCTSCHVSSSGGDLVTAYGRSVAEEKLAAFSHEGEAKPLHGAVAIPEWLLVGGHFRHLQMNYEDDKMKEGRHFTMQQDLDIGVALPKTWAYVTTSSERSEKDPYQYNEKRPIVAKWLVRYDPIESLSIRAGRTMPKFGLNVPDHNAYVRQNIGLGAGKERRIIEATYCSEKIEVNLSSAAEFLPENKVDKLDNPDGQPKEIFANVSTFWKESQRVSISALNRKSSVEKLTLISASTVLTPLNTFRILAEQSNGVSESDIVKTKLANSYLKFWFHPVAGLFPYVLYERQMRGSEMEDQLGDRIAFGASFHPRPHFEIAGSLGSKRDLRKYTFGNSANILFHYWL